MTEALDKLIAAVEAGDDRAAFWKVWTPESECGRLAYVARDAYHGSLDSAVALKDALLPGWGLNLHFVEFADGSFVCTFFGPIADDAPKWTFAPQFVARGTTPARALLFATLKAVKGGADG